MDAALFFNPQGRISKARFQMGALVLIGLAFVLSLVPLLLSGPALLPVIAVLSLIEIVMIYCWVALWVKRLHQAGQTGWLTVLIGFGWVLISSVVEMLVTLSVNPDLLTMSAESANMMEAIRQSLDAAREIALPLAVASAVTGLIVVFALNALLPSQSGENKFGPPPA